LNSYICENVTNYTCKCLVKTSKARVIEDLYLNLVNWPSVFTRSQKKLALCPFLNLNCALMHLVQSNRRSLYMNVIRTYTYVYTRTRNVRTMKITFLGFLL
jgi:hypothetical protein